MWRKASKAHGMGDSSLGPRGKEAAFMSHWGEKGHYAISHTIKRGLIRQQEVQEAAGFDARHPGVFGIPSWPVARVPRAASCGEVG